MDLGNINVHRNKMADGFLKYFVANVAKTKTKNKTDADTDADAVA